MKKVFIYSFFIFLFVQAATAKTENPVTNLTLAPRGWSDYVFNKNYQLRSLQSPKAFINQNNHLPEELLLKKLRPKVLG